MVLWGGEACRNLWNLNAFNAKGGDTIFKTRNKNQMNGFIALRWDGGGALKTGGNKTLARQFNLLFKNHKKQHPFLARTLQPRCSPKET